MPRTKMFLVPKAVAAEAQSALWMHAYYHRGGTHVGLNTAHMLAFPLPEKGGARISLRKVRHIARYFPRHAVDKRAKGFRRRERGYPSAGRIAWGLWGGDAGWRWAQAIVDRYAPLKTKARRR